MKIRNLKKILFPSLLAVMAPAVALPVVLTSTSCTTVLIGKISSTPGEPVQPSEAGHICYEVTLKSHTTINFTCTVQGGEGKTAIWDLKLITEKSTAVKDNLLFEEVVGYGSKQKIESGGTELAVEFDTAWATKITAGQYLIMELHCGYNGSTTHEHIKVTFINPKP